MTECAACKTAIHSPHLLRLGEEGDCYHESCLLCSQCSLPLTSSCYSSNGLLYCRQDFLRLTIPSCASCGKEFQESDQVRSIRGLTFHLQCFQCSVCSLTLERGMKVGQDSQGNIVCQEHFSLGETETGPESPEKSEHEESDKENEEKDGDGETEGDDKKECKDGKRRGPRTNITAKQLEMLKNIFNSNPKPTRLMREQLAKDTGLSMRVIQVWFQNKRSKEKRMHQLRYAGGYQAGGMGPLHHHGMFPPPSNINFNYSQGYYGGYGDQEYYGAMQGPEAFHPFPSPPPQHSDFPLQQNSAALQQQHSEPPCFPSPPLSECNQEYQDIISY